MVIGRLFVSAHVVFGHTRCHLRAIGHLGHAGLRGRRGIGRDLDKQSEAEADHGQDAQQFHWIRLVLQTPKRKTLTI